MKLFLLSIVILGLSQILPVHAQSPSPSPLSSDEITSKEQEIADINEKIKALRQQRDTTAEQAAQIANQVAELQAQLQKTQLQLQQTTLTIKKVQSQQEETTTTITTLQQEIESERQQLKNLIRQLYQKEQESYIRIFFDSFSLSEVLAERALYEELQQRANASIKALKQKEADLNQKQQDLDQQAQDLGQLEDMLAQQKQEAAAQKSAQDQFLQAKKEQQAAFENRIKEAEQAREEIKQQIFRIQGSGDKQVEVSLNNAYDMARHAHKLTGVPPALLLAVLKVESNVGNNIGNGRFPDDMHPQSRDAFIRITAKLGLDPATAQISRRPASGKGWGGAMGAAQIMPATWEGIEPRLEQLLGKSPVNPYELTDAFVATAIFLADRGAADPARTRETVGRYIAGPNWQYYGWYIDKVMAVAREYEQDGV